MQLLPDITIVYIDNFNDSSIFEIMNIQCSAKVRVIEVNNKKCLVKTIVENQCKTCATIHMCGYGRSATYWIDAAGVKKGDLLELEISGNYLFKNLFLLYALGVVVSAAIAYAVYSATNSDISAAIIFVVSSFIWIFIAPKIITHNNITLQIKKRL